MFQAKYFQYYQKLCLIEVRTSFAKVLLLQFDYIEEQCREGWLWSQLEISPMRNLHRLTP